MKFDIAATLLSALAFGVARASGLRNVPEERGLQQASSKFAAAWSEEVEVAGECLNTDNQDMIDFWGTPILNYDFCDDPAIFDSNDNSLVLSQFAGVGKIKIPQGKEILVTLSAQIDILTTVTATSEKKGGRDQNGDGEQDYYGNIGATFASAGVSVKLYAVPERAGVGATVQCKPDGVEGVTMASRYVELRNQIGGEVTYEDCYNDETDALVCPIKVANTTLSSTIGLAMSTAAAHSFQWLCVDLDSDIYDVVAMFEMDAEVRDLCDDSNFGDCSEVADLAAARIALNKRMMTIQQVRATNKAFAELD